MKQRSRSASTVDWPRVVASGALWMVVYNLVWGIAWFSFMRHEWNEAVDSIGIPSPWTAEVWFLWVVFTFPIGVAIAAHAATQASFAAKPALYAAAALWLMMTVGMAVWSVAEKLPIRVIAIDSAVNLIGMLAGSLACVWSLGRESQQPVAPSNSS